MTFKVGDVVQLKSGRPPMTVKEIDEEEATCQWFSDNKADIGIFPVESLKIYPK